MCSRLLIIQNISDISFFKYWCCLGKPLLRKLRFRVVVCICLIKCVDSTRCHYSILNILFIDDGELNHCGVASYVKEDHGYFKDDGVESEVEMELEGDGEIEENDAATVHEAVEAGVSQVVSALALPGTSSSTPVRSPYKHCVTDSSTGKTPDCSSCHTYSWILSVKLHLDMNFYGCLC